MIPFFKNKIDSVMDYIRLERVQPFASTSSASSTRTSSPTPPLESSSNVLSPNQRKTLTLRQARQAHEERITRQAAESTFTPRTPTVTFTQTRLNHTPMQPVTIQRIEPIDVEINRLRETFNDVTGNSFTQLCTNPVPVAPISDEVIPVMAFASEVIDHQKLINSSEVGELTIAKALEPFSPTSIKPKGSKHAKLQFVFTLIQKISRLSRNFDFAIICREESVQTLSQFTANASTSKDRSKTAPGTMRTLISTYAPSSGLHGLLYKHRKLGAGMNPNFKPLVDLVLVYDSACDVGQGEILKLFKGPRDRDPRVFHLCCMDSPDIRIHDYNIRHPLSPIAWNTKVSELNGAVKNSLFLQPNRIVNNIGDSPGWSDTVSQSLINSISSRTFTEYSFQLPTKGKMITVYREFVRPRGDRFMRRPTISQEVAAGHPKTSSKRPRDEISIQTAKKKKSPMPPPLSKKQRQQQSMPKKSTLAKRQALAKMHPYGDGLTRRERQIESNSNPVRIEAQNDYRPDLRVPVPFPTATGYVLNPVSDFKRVSLKASGSRISNGSNDRNVNSGVGGSGRGSSVIIIDDPIDFSSTPMNQTRPPRSSDASGSNATPMKAAYQPRSDNATRFSPTAVASAPVAGWSGSDVSWNRTPVPNHQPLPSSAGSVPTGPIPTGPANMSGIVPTFPDKVSGPPPPSRVETPKIQTSVTSEVVKKADPPTNDTGNSVSFAAELSSNLDNLFSDALKQFEMDLDALNIKF